MHSRFRVLWGAFSDQMSSILAEWAVPLSLTLSGGALFASRKLLQFPSSLIVKVILAIFRRASAQQKMVHVTDRSDTEPTASLKAS
jgi:hypothetical protein